MRLSAAVIRLVSLVVTFFGVAGVPAAHVPALATDGVRDGFLDGRLSAEVIRVLAVQSPAADNYYAATLFDPDQAYAGSCTARSTIYTASIAAGLMVGQTTRWLRGLPVHADLLLNLLSGELLAGGPD